MSEPMDFPRVPRRGVTPRQKEILEVINASMATRGYAPSMREIADVVGLASPSSVKHQLEVLEAKGYVRRDRRIPRAIEVVDPDADTPANLRGVAGEATPPRYVPLVGRVAAGTPILASQMIEEMYPFPREITGQGEVFMLKVQGDSMVGAGIQDGDYVIVRSQTTAENGQIVAAQIGDEATVKTFAAGDGGVWLRPENPAYSPIEARKAHIVGRVVAVIRRL